MNREQFAEMIYWSWIIWAFGIINVGAMLPQLIQIIRTKMVEGLNLSMFGIYLAIQVAFSLQGFFRRDTMLMVCLGLSAVVSLTIIILVKSIRRSGQKPERRMTKI